MTPKWKIMAAVAGAYALSVGAWATAAFAVAPGAPASCSAAVAEGGVLVSWTAPTSGGTPTEYHVRESGFSTPLVKVPAPNLSALWTDALRDDTPQFAVRAKNADGWSKACLAPLGTEPPPPPDEEPPPPPDEPPPPADGSLPYTADSFFKSRVDGANVPIDQTRTTSFKNFMASHPDQSAIYWPKINVNQNWAMSYHVGTAKDPIWTLTGGNTTHEKLAHLRTKGFHMADSVADTFPDGTQDRPGVMIDKEFGYTVQFADAVPNKATRTISVSNAAVFYHGSNGLDYRNPRSNDERNFSSRGRIPDAMVVRRDVLDKAVAAGTGLGHVLHLFFVETKTTDGVVHPMVGAEGNKSGWGAEGERIRLRPDINLEARGLTGAALAVARTLQEHGAYIGDNSGSSTQIKASQPQHYVGTNITTDALKGKVSWNDFEVVEQGWQ